MYSNPNHLYQMLYGGISTGDIRLQHEARSNMLNQIEKLAATKKTPREIVEELYLLAYARLPVEDELKAALSLFDEKDIPRREAIEDLLWALLNTPEFVFQN